MREGAASRTNRESEDLSENLNGYLVDKDNRTIRGKTGTPRINIFGPGIFFAFFSACSGWVPVPAPPLYSPDGAGVYQNLLEVR